MTPNPPIPTRFAEEAWIRTYDDLGRQDGYVLVGETEAVTVVPLAEERYAVALYTRATAEFYYQITAPLDSFEEASARLEDFMLRLQTPVPPSRSSWTTSPTPSPRPR